MTPSTDAAGSWNFFSCTFQSLMVLSIKMRIREQHSPSVPYNIKQVRTVGGQKVVAIIGRFLEPAQHTDALFDLK